MLRVGALVVEILPIEGSVKYFGRKVSFENHNQVEFENRMAAAWVCFSKYKDELTNRKYSLASMLRLLNATVTATSFTAAKPGC